MEWLNENWEWILPAILYAMERSQEFHSRRKAKKQSEADGTVVETTSPDRVTKGQKVKGLLFDLLPLVSRIKRRK